MKELDKKEALELIELLRLRKKLGVSSTNLPKDCSTELRLLSNLERMLGDKNEQS
jgi:hypothetical protein